LPKLNNRKIDDPLSLLGKVAINLDRMHFSVNGDLSVIRSCELLSEVDYLMSEFVIPAYF
jgi:hypothetical protein